MIYCTCCQTRLDGDYGDYYIVGASEFPACSFECVRELPGLENGVKKIIDGKIELLDKDNDMDSPIYIATRLSRNNN
ncbi:hypothetical protein [Lysinibacillus sp. ZYM-1]|uniref:hypothetical protein n=1 Tax=Lysinibacillus sp. ZYM-1 TaxID=1681184 RepID=UPI0006CE8292|nr:hypothetical protein [Lysinibacillus sp. ZYM-1]KPN96081.1 hypothetical protein AO843_19040 [Lysinibacillus sp. ZYM-1]